MKSRTKRFLYLLLFITCVFSVSRTSFAQESRTITGTIKGQNDNAPITGVSVYVKGKITVGTTTDALGHFALKVPSGTETLVVSSVGMKDKEVSVKGTNNVDVTLSPAAQAMNEVVVVGYGTQKRSLVTGAITSIKGADLVQPGAMRADDALQGKAAGVTVTANSGQPGTGMSIRIRGVGTNGTAQPLYIVDGVIVGDIEYLSPTDIESLEVMKDAASSAIYGARGGNGVIIITTKKGLPGKSTVQYNSYYGWQNIARKIPVLDAHEYTVIQNEAAANGGQSKLPFSAEDLDYYSKYKGTDWQEAVLYRNAPVMQHQISLRGGDKQSSYSMSGAYFSQNGILAKGKSQFERYTFNITADRKFLNDALTTGANVTISRVQKQSVTQNSLTAGPLVGALNMDPLTPVYDTTLTLSHGKEYGGFAASNYVSQEVVNPVARIYFNNSPSWYTKMMGTGFAELKFLRDFRIKTAGTANFTWDGSKSYTPIYKLNSTTGTTHTGAGQSMSEVRTLTWDNTLTYIKKLGNHDITALVGTSSQHYTPLAMSGSRNDLIIDDPNYAWLSMASSAAPSVSGGPLVNGNYEASWFSYFGRVNYSYDNRFMFTAIFRRDGSSRFGPNNKYGTFPSVSAGWNLSNEKFMKDIAWINNLKLRAGWGRNGNDNIGDFQYLSTISTYAMGYAYGSQSASQSIATGADPLKTPNPALKWETVEQSNIGVDLVFLNDFTATIDIYSKTTKDLLMIAKDLLMYGDGPRSFPTKNVGNVNNKGIELSLSYKKKIGQVLLDVNANAAYNKNTVTKVDNGSGFVGGVTMQGFGSSPITRMEVGHPMAYFWGLKTMGIFQNQDEINNYVYSDIKTGVKNLVQPKAQPGDFKFQDTNGDGVINENDKVDLGNPNPDWTGGFNLNLGYHGFDLTINNSFATGNQVFSVLRRVDLPMSNYANWVLGRWHGEGTSNSIPRVTQNDQNQSWSSVSDFYVKDGSYWRVRNVSLGYTFNRPFKYFQSIKVYGAAQNLFTFTKYYGWDPEIGGSPMSTGVDYGVYPHPRTITVGCNINL
ncbi:SusC/RagA family TonB-linked outer membrane protein [Pinibacter soli]|uniref:TonB-dependent receptor n=1 Tax=Pinibacter soli TaxID=3044211 RepID=A0ABT6RGG3_9BACT|nr:TonB-dependent receptor [Pinibacter soli]MDI3320942.1 TonB-dependent receptor [Pinibacter soli]